MWRSTSTVGFPLESRISRAKILTMDILQKMTDHQLNLVVVHKNQKLIQSFSDFAANGHTKRPACRFSRTMITVTQPSGWKTAKEASCEEALHHSITQLKDIDDHIEIISKTSTVNLLHATSQFLGCFSQIMVQ